VTERGFVYIRKEKDWWEGGKICIYDIGNIVDPSWSPEIDSHPGGAKIAWRNRFLRIDSLAP
jgi:hypothetical protein